MFVRVVSPESLSIALNYISSLHMYSYCLVRDITIRVTLHKTARLLRPLSLV